MGHYSLEGHLEAPGVLVATEVGAGGWSGVLQEGPMLDWKETHADWSMICLEVLELR